MEQVRSTQAPTERRASAPGARDGLGAKLARSGKELLQCGRTLSTLVEPAGQTLIREAESTLDAQTFRVVVVGQIKAGKSSFINALVRQPYLLPTDVTPWTTAITNLHFAKQSPGEYSAAFHFFSEGEWRELAEGGGPVRELTQRLVPGFDPELLGRQVAALKERAGERLGSEFQSLLGGTHYFDGVSRELLLRYVCSGEVFADPSGSPFGKYADITKRADLYLDTGPFAFPVTVTDTPGTNDPFLIRDELTRRSLKAADLYIVVLSARQPLSESDLALMRLMHGLNKDRIIAFVNRIDDFADVSYDLAEVLIFVEKRLQAEFPGASIPVIAGSAAWANCALMPEPEICGHVLERSSFSYLTELGLVRQEDRTLDAIADPECRQRLCRGLLTASGLPAIYIAIADRMAQGQAARSQLKIARCFREMAQASTGSLRYELQLLEESQTATKRQQEEMAELDKNAELLNYVADNVERSAKNIEHQLLRIIDEEMDTLRDTLRRIVDHHAASERRVLVDTLRRGKIPRAWTHEGVELRRALAGTFAKGFDRAMTRVIDFQARVAPELHRLMRLVAPEIPQPAQPGREAIETPMPNVSALSRFVALDLDKSWWRGVWRRREAPVTYGDQIEALIKSEFQSVVDELVQTAESALNGYAATTTRWSFALCVNIVQAVKRQREQMAMHRSNVERVASGAGAPDTDRHEQQVQALHQKVQQCQALHRRLDAITNELGAAFKAQTGPAS